MINFKFLKTYISLGNRNTWKILKKKSFCFGKKNSAPIPIPKPIVSAEIRRRYRISVGHYIQIREFEFVAQTVDNLFNFSAQNSDLKYFFGPLQTFWQKATFSCMVLLYWSSKMYFEWFVLAHCTVCNSKNCKIQIFMILMPKISWTLIFKWDLLCLFPTVFWWFQLLKHFIFWNCAQHFLPLYPSHS